MSFLAPLFLVALGALAIPVLIHLTQRERKQIVEFPSLMFLRRIPYPSVRRRRIRNWLLLLVRLTALLLIVSAFARPFLKRPELAASGSSGPREVVLLLDRSYSMGYGDHWERARAAARRAVRALGANDRASLIFFATGAELDVRSTTDRGRLLAAIDAARVGSRATRYGPALKLAQRVLIESQLPRREAILISDFQKIGWNREEDLRLPEGATLTPISVAEAETSNVTVSSVMLQRATFSGQERVTVSTGLVNRSASRVSNLQVELEVDGRQIQAQPVTLQSNGSASLTFQPFILTSPYTRGTVRVAPDRLPQDNALHFVLSPGQPLPVLIVEPSRAARDASLYLTRALGIGTAPAFQVEVKSAEQIATGDLEERSVVILNDAALSTGSRAAQLRRFVEQGGGLLVVLGEHAAWTDEARDLLPGLPGPPVDRATGRGGTIGEIDYSHPIFELFKAPRSGDFSAARFFRYRAVTIGSEPGATGSGLQPSGSAPRTTGSGLQAPGDHVRVLARFDDGAVALAERMIGQGLVIVWPSTLDTFWNDLVLKPVFLPFLHQTVRYLARYEAPASWFAVGQVVDAGTLLQATGSRLQASAKARSPESASRSPKLEAQSLPRVVLTPSGESVPLPGGERPGVLELAEPGFYEIHVRGGEEDRPLTIAANLDVSESDLSPLDPQELAAAVAGRTGSRNAAGETAQVMPEDQERRQAVWWYLLLAGIVILGIETVASNWLPPTAG